MAKTTYKKDSNAPSAEDKALDKFADTILKKIETLKEKWDKPWFSAGGMMAENINGRAYNGMNQVMLLLVTEDKGWAAPIFATFDKFMSMNYDKEGNYLPADVFVPMPKVSVTKGEISTPVFITTYNVVHKETKEKITMTEFLAMSEEEKENYRVYNNTMVHNVFNIDQTNLAEARPDVYKELVAKNKPKENDGTGFRFPKMDDLIENNGWIVPIYPKRQNRAFYSPKEDHIVIPLYKQFKTGEAYYATALHEMAHSTGRKDNLNREGVANFDGFGTKQYGTEELIAELTSALVCHTNGIQNGIQEQSAAYIEGWCKNIKEDPKYIKTVLTEVKKAYQLIDKYVDTIQ